MIAQYTDDERGFLRRYLDDHYFGECQPGHDPPCLMAAINYSVTGELCDGIPVCMSEIIGNWLVAIQNRMPDDRLNSYRMKMALLEAPATGRSADAELRRLEAVMQWMWSALSVAHHTAAHFGFGDQWGDMLFYRSREAAWTCAQAASDAVALVSDAASTDKTFGSMFVRPTPEDAKRSAALIGKLIDRGVSAEAYADVIVQAASKAITVRDSQAVASASSAALNASNAAIGVRAMDFVEFNPHAIRDPKLRKAPSYAADAAADMVIAADLNIDVAWKLLDPAGLLSQLCSIR